VPVPTAVQPETASVSVPIPLSWRDTIDRLAAEQGTNRANVARRMIANALRDHMPADELVYETYSGNGRAGGAWLLPDDLQAAVEAVYQRGYGVYPTGEICGIGCDRTWNALGRAGIELRGSKLAGVELVPAVRVVQLLQSGLEAALLSTVLELPVEVIETLIARHSPANA
jgi:hypothetical protein